VSAISSRTEAWIGMRATDADNRASDYRIACLLSWKSPHRGYAGFAGSA
jgi:hypothetical protein